MGHSGDDAVLKTPHKMTNKLAESAEKFGIGLIYHSLKN